MSVALGDDRGLPSRQQFHKVVVLNEESADRTQHAVGLLQDAPVVGVVEVPERGKPTHHAIEALIRPGQQAHVAFDVVDIDAARCRVAPGAVEKQRRGVESGHSCAALGEPVGDTAVSAREVKDGHVRLELQEAPDCVDVRLGDVREQRLVEEEIVRVEDLVEVERHAHRPERTPPERPASSAEGQWTLAKGTELGLRCGRATDRLGS